MFYGTVHVAHACVFTYVLRVLPHAADVKSNLRDPPRAQVRVHVHVRAGRDARGAIGASKDAKIDFSGAASNIALTSHSNWKEFDISKVASVDGLSFDI